MNKKMFIMSTALVLAGCKSTPLPSVFIEKLTLPNIGVQSKAGLGDSLFMQAKGEYRDTIALANYSSFTVNVEGSEFHLANDGKYYSRKEKTIKQINAFGEVTSKTNHFKYDGKEVCFYLDDDNPILKNKFAFNIGNCFDDIPLTQKGKTFVIVENSFQRSIEYNGKQNNTLQFTYREFSKNMARQSFTQPFTMDLSEGKTLSYKGAVIEVERATNMEIKYTVVKDFRDTI